MVRTCKYVERNQKERRCSDYYYSHSEKHSGVFCRLTEWKKKKGTCPYDKTIYSTQKKIKKALNKNQKTLLDEEL